MITDKTAAALRIIKGYPRGITPRALAELLWPDSKCWKHSHKCGAYGAHMGGMMYVAAGGYLGRLRARGLTVFLFDEYMRGFHHVTAEGKAALAEWEERHAAE